MTTYTWDQENRLISVAVPSTGLTTYVYSDDGHRQATITGAGTTNFIYDGDIVLQETNASGITQVHYAQGPGTWGLLTAQNRGGTIQYYGPDDRENVRLVLSSAGAALDNNQYKAFLEQLNTPTQTNPFLGGGNVGGRLEVLNYIRFGQRLYIPALGVWLNMDMLGFDGGSKNWYQYVENNPIYATDPTGLGSLSWTDIKNLLEPGVDTFVELLENEKLGLIFKEIWTILDALDCVKLDGLDDLE